MKKKNNFRSKKKYDVTTEISQTGQYLYPVGNKKHKKTDDKTTYGNKEFWKKIKNNK